MDLSSHFRNLSIEDHDDFQQNASGPAFPRPAPHSQRAIFLPRPTQFAASSSNIHAPQPQRATYLPTPPQFASSSSNIHPPQPQLRFSLEIHALARAFSTSANITVTPATILGNPSLFQKLMVFQNDIKNYKENPDSCYRLKLGLYRAFGMEFDVSTLGAGLGHLRCLFDITSPYFTREEANRIRHCSFGEGQEQTVEDFMADTFRHAWHVHRLTYPHAFDLSGYGDLSKAIAMALSSIFGFYTFSRYQIEEMVTDNNLPRPSMLW